jgi:peptidyl-dipeptidase A
MRRHSGGTGLAALLLSAGAVALWTVPATAAAQVKPPVTQTKPPVTQGAATGGMKQLPPTVNAARVFMAKAERELGELTIKANQAGWVSSNFITEDTEALNADATQALNVAVQKYAMEAKRFDNIRLPDDLARKFKLLKLGFTAPPPADPAMAAELSKLTVGMEADYGKGKYCRTKSGKEECLDINDITRIMAESRDPEELKDVWVGWEKVGAPMRDRYSRFVLLANQGATTLGYANVGELWRSGYDMPPDAFARELDRLWNQVRPLYVALHTYVRGRLNQQYGDAVVGKTGLIPAHLLGNIWAQDWSNLYPIVAPKSANATDMYDVTELLKKKGMDQLAMAHTAENFFTSMGLQKLPATFWERSLITKPRDREVVCHASAWVMNNKDDVRIKMCTNVTAEDFSTLHHEMGHDYYYLAYQNQPLLFQNGANDGFHEAIGDALALSITPQYLKTIGLLETVPSAAADTALLLQRALADVAFLPFGLLVDQWRWKVFSGEVTSADYNKSWWDLRAKYQGVAPPVARTEADFDPGAKYHVAANVPYSRYFLAAILHYQFYRALCKEAGYTGPLNRCSFYGSKAAGDKLWKMLSLGASKPWPDALYELTGQREMDASAMMDYYAPLLAWLNQQNKGMQSGW